MVDRSAPAPRPPKPVLVPDVDDKSVLASRHGHMIRPRASAQRPKCCARPGPQKRPRGTAAVVEIDLDRSRFNRGSARLVRQIVPDVAEPRLSLADVRTRIRTAIRRRVETLA